MTGRRARGESGQALVIVVLFMGVLLGMCALALDVGHAYLAKRRLQASVDAAAVVAAQALPDADAAKALAADYGPDGENPVRGVDSVRMTVDTRCLKAVRGCSTANAVVVQETGTVPTTFARLFGIDDFDVHARATACSPCGSKPLDVMLVLDRTGSMCTDELGHADPGCADLNYAKAGMRTFLELLDPDLDHVGLAVLPPAPSAASNCDRPPNATATTYDDPSSRYVLERLSSDYLLGGKLNPASSLVQTIDCIQGNGSTAYANALEKAQEELVRDGRPGVTKVVVFLSDGAANTGPLFYPASSPYLLKPCHQGIDSARTIAATGTVVYSIGYDLEHDRCQAEAKATQARSNEIPAITSEQALRGIASAPDNFYVKPDAGQLNTIFTSIAADILHGTSKLVDDDA